MADGPAHMGGRSASYLGKLCRNFVFLVVRAKLNYGRSGSLERTVRKSFMVHCGRSGMYARTVRRLIYRDGSGGLVLVNGGRFATCWRMVRWSVSQPCRMSAEALTCASLNDGRSAA
jgi:hypothetical protein